MKFLDEARIFLASGSGGNGCVSFHRAKNLPRGGPDGGNGGRGGSVIIKAVSNRNTLVDFRFKQHFSAQNGSDGFGAQRHGKNGADMVLSVPVGTQVFEEDGTTLLADLSKPDQSVLLLEGGRGGLGNTAFKNAVRQAPRLAKAGKKGIGKWFMLKLKIIADVGLVGLPNAGKSTFLGALSRARPKVADYPFTTLVPSVGVVALLDEAHPLKTFVLADIPGLIEGAHQGVGLGQRFLRHLERCALLLYLFDGTSDVYADYHMLRRELACYGPKLAEKPIFCAINKIDLLTEEAQTLQKKALEDACGHIVFLVSALKKIGLDALLREIGPQLESGSLHKERELLKSPSKWHPLDSPGRR